MLRIHTLAKEITLDELCSLLEDCQVQQSLDLGSTMLHVAEHTDHGDLILISTVCGRAAYLPL